MPKTCLRISLLVRVFVPSCTTSAVSAASPVRSAGSLEYPDNTVSVTLTFGTAVCRVTMTRRPLGNVRSTRGASWNGRSGPTAGRSVCANALDANKTSARMKLITTEDTVDTEEQFCLAQDLPPVSSVAPVVEMWFRVVERLRG